MKPSTKTAAIENLLRRSCGLTAVGAFELLADTHLASTVHRLRRAGVVVQDEWCVGFTRFGKPCKFKLYRITH